MACSGGTPVTAFKTALVVGTILVAINQGHWILQGKYDNIPWWSVVLTYFVPYFVNTHGAVMSKLRQAQVGQNLINERWQRRLATREETAAAVDNTVAALRESYAAYGGQPYNGPPLEEVRATIQRNKQLAEEQLKGTQEEMEAPSSSQPLWTAHQEEKSGKTYYVNAVTLETSWEAPPGAAPSSAAAEVQPEKDAV